MKNNKNFGAKDWKKYIPMPICDEHPEYKELYLTAWELAFDHIKFVDGMPQNPYMDDAFCDTQIWFWDTCFMALFCKYAREVFPGIESLNNFYEVLYNNGRLGAILPTENEPDWTGAKVGEPYEIQVHIADNPPIFAWAEYENALMHGDKEYLKELLYEKQFLQKHFEWVENLKESSTLSGVFAETCLKAEKYGYKWEGGRSGMDNTPRGRTGEHAERPRPNNPNMLWIDAICQQALSAKMIAKMFALVGDSANEAVWNEKYKEKKNIINEHYWDAQDEFYYDIDCNTLDFYKIKSMASYWTMTSGVATKTEAEILAKHLENDKTFGGLIPFVSLSRDDNDFCSDGSYWRGGVWLPSAYATLKGLKDYGFLDIAKSTSEKLLDHMYKTYKEVEPHTLWEAYSPDEFKPATNEFMSGNYVRPDFCGWTALGPISIYIEFILGFHTVDAFTKTVEWEKPDFKGEMGIRNLRFGEIITDIVAIGDVCKVTTNSAYTLKINGKDHKIVNGENEFKL